MSFISIARAYIEDSEKLTDIATRTFNEEAKKWLSAENNVIDYNIQPPGYSSNEVTKYMIRELDYFKIQFDQQIVGGIIVTISGKSYGRIDRIFIDPQYQGRRIGSTVIEMIEDKYPRIKTWDLETSSRQINNHHFYEKMGYQTTFETEDEYCYIKRKEITSDTLVENEDLSGYQYENINLASAEYYQVNLEGSAFSNSNMRNVHISNCNLSHSKLHNINFRNTLFADLNLANSKLEFVTLGGASFVETTQDEGNTPITFDRCDLSGSVIRNCTLKDASIQDSDLTGMRINNIPVEELLKAFQQIHKNN